ncbi:CvfD/Ygs/GSP13 family RNA-binding post-transcriptional regulator [Enterococcus sp.]|uniref:CvfD/Ygs/GSP13 family RNA-binding post-transcriptional regulator n=1 Tax=Enterococcus sp. TaxID=35783 RepID=UPI00290C3639|nr:CvfD/Ygs/GSP13 family RNA-binding post-transcriptional regulator [Enterococcus sp.]MDU5334754.1 CvfD/Ygs/GSP13 family RNA-binding post-transcriptional regulator [Enterococcus sp.]
MGYKIGDIIEGQVTGIQPYGAFISLDDQTQGLVHISEVQSGYTKNIHSFLEVGQSVKVQVIDIDEFTKKISLSIRTLAEHSTEAPYHRKRYFTNRNKNIGFRSLEKNMPHWTDEAIDFLLKERVEN